MYKDVLTRIEGIDLFPLIALVIFFTFFMLLITWVVRLNRSYIDAMGNMPLDGDEGPGQVGRLNETDILPANQLKSESHNNPKREY